MKDHLSLGNLSLMVMIMLIGKLELSFIFNLLTMIYGYP